MGLWRWPNVYITAGFVMLGLTAQMAQMKLIAVQLHVKTKVYGIVAMASVFLHTTFVMDQANGVTQAGVLTVLMEQMKTSIAAVHLATMPMIYVTLQHTVKTNQHVI